MSPNSMALTMLASMGRRPPPKPISRRFVVDLSFDDALGFIEYEWFSDGKLCVSMHSILPRGGYRGESILLDRHTPEGDLHQDIYLTKADLLSADRAERADSPTRVIMRLYFTEMSDTVATFQRPTNWETWLSAFSAARSGNTHVNIRYSVITSLGDRTDELNVPIKETTQIGIDINNSADASTLRMFLSDSHVMTSHPAVDETVVYEEQRRERLEIGDDAFFDNTWGEGLLNGLHPIDDLDKDGSESGEEDHSTLTAVYIKPPLDKVNLPPKPQPLVKEPNLEPTTDQEEGWEGATNQATSQIQALSLCSTSASETTSHTTRAKEPTSFAKIERLQKRKGVQKGRIFQCECGKKFRHRGHYNEHRLCVHEKVRQHKCFFVNCDSKFFKKSDRDRHMRSKHESIVIKCPDCGERVHGKDALSKHVRENCNPRPNRCKV